ncbi:MAG: glycosyltransferase [Chloroflexi bacterium]|nr:glycosyltransferase [Chloroflexota bacterium]
MNAAVVVTTLNEAASIAALLESLARQSRPADEIILVDGGSEDDTLLIARGFLDRLPGLKILDAPGANISQGRNAGIAAAQSGWIAITDAGCEPQPRWLADMLARLGGQPAAEIVSGVVVPQAANHLEACIAACSLAFRLKVDGVSFFPTARSLAFTRDLWRRAGGFPERLEYGEDAQFILAAAAAGGRLALAEAAQVGWRPRGSYSQVIRQFYRYAWGLAQAGLSRRFHLRTATLSLSGFACLLLALLSRSWLPWALLLALAALYFLRKARQGVWAIPGWRTLYRIPLVLACIHLGTLAGMIHGNLARGSRG